MFFNSIKGINRLRKEINRLSSKKYECFQWMFFNSIKEINRLRKEINTLLIKEMSNIYIKVTILKKSLCSQNFDFLSLKNFSPGQFLGSCNSRRYY